MKLKNQNVKWQDIQNIIEVDTEDENSIIVNKQISPSAVQKPLKLKLMEYKLREKHFEAQFMKDYRLPESEVAEKKKFEKNLIQRREMVYPEYDLHKLWKDTQQIKIKGLMDFADTDLEWHRKKIVGWQSDQNKIRSWKDQCDMRIIKAKQLTANNDEKSVSPVNLSSLNKESIFLSGSNTSFLNIGSPGQSVMNTKMPLNTQESQIHSISTLLPNYGKHNQRANSDLGGGYYHQAGLKSQSILKNYKLSTAMSVESTSQQQHHASPSSQLKINLKLQQLALPSVENTFNTQRKPNIESSFMQGQAINVQDGGNTNRSVISQNQLLKIEEFRAKLKEQKPGDIQNIQTYQQRFRQAQHQGKQGANNLLLQPLSMRLPKHDRSTSQVDYSPQMFSSNVVFHQKNHLQSQPDFSSGFPSTTSKKKITEQEWLYPNVLRDLRMPVDSIIKPHQYIKQRILIEGSRSSLLKDKQQQSP